MNGRRGLLRGLALLALLWAGCAAQPAAIGPASEALGPGPRSVPLVVPHQPIEADGEYLIGPGDLLLVRIHELERPDQTTILEVEVTRRGTILLPLLDEVQAGGRTTTGLLRELKARLAGRFLVDPRVMVAIKEYRSHKITVAGAVKAPGTFAVPRNEVTVIEALSLAQGLSDSAGVHAVLVRSRQGKGPRRVLINLEHLLSASEEQEHVGLRTGDVLVVPPAEQVYVIGYVHKPGGYPIRGRITALEAVATAGGPILGTASPSACFLRRRLAGGRHRILPLDLDAILRGESTDLLLHPGDTIMVPQTRARAFAMETWSFIKGRVGSVGLGAIP